MKNYRVLFDAHWIDRCNQAFPTYTVRNLGQFSICAQYTVSLILVFIIHNYGTAFFQKQISSTVMLAWHKLVC